VHFNHHIHEYYARDYLRYRRASEAYKHAGYIDHARTLLAMANRAYDLWSAEPRNGF
jgi:hypothetical protein